MNWRHYSVIELVMGLEKLMVGLEELMVGLEELMMSWPATALC